ncbi:MAG: hypothetical protein VZS44_04095 [Bacilli bacterium]|nr:hypothetical protein [Bacilli bacterium]
MFYFAAVDQACLTTLGIFFFLRELLKYVSIIIPIGLILMISIDIFKGTISFEEHPKVIQYVVRRLIYAMVIFLIPSSVFSLFNILEITDNNGKSCWNYAGELSVDEVKKVMEDNEKKMNEEVDRLREEIAKQYHVKAKTTTLRTIVSANSSGSNNTGSNTVVVGQKYNLSSSDLKSLAFVAYKEQGSAVGAAAEATLMANRYELHGKKYSSLKSYVRDSGWFAHSKSRIDSPGFVPDAVMSSVKDVLVNGNRTLPLYIDEHDYFGDISKIVTSGKTYDGYVSKRWRSHYIPNNTVIYNKMGATYTFYVFPTSGSDPFGYTKAAKNKIDSLN